MRTFPYILYAHVTVAQVLLHLFHEQCSSAYMQFIKKGVDVKE